MVQFFSFFSFRLFGVYLLGFRRISSDYKLKDSSASRENKEILQFNTRNWKDEDGDFRVSAGFRHIPGVILSIT